MWLWRGEMCHLWAVSHWHSQLPKLEVVIRKRKKKKPHTRIISADINCCLHPIRAWLMAFWNWCTFLLLGASDLTDLLIKFIIYLPNILLAQRLGIIHPLSMCKFVQVSNISIQHAGQLKGMCAITAVSDVSLKEKVKESAWIWRPDYNCISLGGLIHQFASLAYFSISVKNGWS